MAVLRLVVDRKYVQRHLESYDGDNLVEQRGDTLVELLGENKFPNTRQQYDTLVKLVNDAGIQLELGEDGSLKLI